MCETVFLVCRPCAFNQRYCQAACVELARQESRRQAHRRYRHSPEGRAQHRDEEQRRRDRRRVGDQLVQVAAAAARVAIVEAAQDGVAPRRVMAGLTRWRVVVGAALVAVAESLRAHRTVVTCAGCGRRGHVVAIVVRGESPWRAAARQAQRQRRQRGDDGA